MTKAQLKQLVREAIQEMSTDVSIDQLKDYFLKNPDKLELDLSGGEDVGVSEDSEYMGRNLTVDEAEELQHDRDFMKNIINAKGITKHDAVFGGRYESKGFTKAKLKQIIREAIIEMQSTGGVTRDLGFANGWSNEQRQQVRALTKDGTLKTSEEGRGVERYTYTLKQPLVSDVTVGSMTIPKGTSVITYRVDSSD